MTLSPGRSSHLPTAAAAAADNTTGTLLADTPQVRSGPGGRGGLRGAS